jgi:hypothetical protein
MVLSLANLKGVFTVLTAPLDENGTVVRKFSYILVLPEYWTLGPHQRALLPDPVHFVTRYLSK